MEHELKREVWAGALPLKVALAEDEVSSYPAPKPMFVMLPRHSYLPLLVTTLRTHFEPSLLPGADTMWLDYGGLPLKWHLPAGVLFDVLADGRLPWSVTVHFRGFPVDILQRCDSEEAVRSSFLNSLKEAEYLVHRSTDSVMGMKRETINELWRSVVSGQEEVYTNASASLSSANDVRRVPVRLFAITPAGDSSKGASRLTWDSVVVATRVVDAMDAAGQQQTLRTTLALCLPQQFASDGVTSLASDEGSGAGLLVTIQGVTAPLDAPLGWLCKHLSGPDNFLHICVRMKPR
eukprot:jgi/Chlat1/6562/Chrsp45S05929